jgi:Acetamidase/Formamidase family
MDHILVPDDRTLHGHFSSARAPVLTIDPGDTVTFGTLDCWWSADPYTDGHFPDRPRVPQYRPEFGHALTDPVFVRGAHPGGTLSVRIDAVVPARQATRNPAAWPPGFRPQHRATVRGGHDDCDHVVAQIPGGQRHNRRRSTRVSARTVSTATVPVGRGTMTTGSGDQVLGG